MEITTRKYVEIQQMVIIFFVPEEKEGTTESLIGKGERGPF